MRGFGNYRIGAKPPGLRSGGEDDETQRHDGINRGERERREEAQEEERDRNAGKRDIENEHEIEGAPCTAMAHACRAWGAERRIRVKKPNIDEPPKSSLII
jgi:hypothetical protein